jgi:alkylation response protein AidB-like acyl-CoA dehydrogenase
MPIDFELSKPQNDLKHLGRELARDFGTRALQHDQDRSLPLENFAKLRAPGLYGIALPEALGGLGVGTLGWVAVAEELAQGDASTALAFNMQSTRRAVSSSGRRSGRS